MPTTPVRNAGEPLTSRDALDLVRVFETGRSPNPSSLPAEDRLPSLIDDLPVSGHGDDLYLYEVEDIEWTDAAGRRVNPPKGLQHQDRALQAFDKVEGQPPKPTWRDKKTPLRDMKIKFKRAQGDTYVGTWHGSALLNALNAKVGCYTWSLPEGAACPGRSAFCRDCYAVKMSEGRKQSTMMAARMLRLQAWSLHRAEWKKEMLAECAHYGAVAPIRLHVAGDFFNAEYVEDWFDIISKTPTVYYWGYTRSWNADQKTIGGKALVKALERLRALPNLVLFASFDPTMPRPPASWRWASIHGDPRGGFDARGNPRKVILCPEIAGTPADWKGIREKGRPPLGPDGYPLRATCRKCGWCWFQGDMSKTGRMTQAESAERGLGPMGSRDRKGDVSFPRHGAVVELADPSIPWPVAAPTKEEVHAYSVFRNGGGKGNRVEYSTAMAQLHKSTAKIEMADEMLKHDKEDHAAKFYFKEFDKLLGDAKVAAREIEASS